MAKIYYIKVNEDDNTGIGAISLVDYPAVEKNFLCFNEDKKPVMLKADESKHIITGVIALADTPIYRYDKTLGEYYIVFTKDTIQEMVEKFAREDLFKSVNLQHDSEQFVDGIYMIESYIVNKDRGILPVEFDDIPDGSWVASYKVDNEDLWNEIVNGDKLNGFSLEGMFQYKEKLAAESKQETFDEWIEKILK